MPDIGPDSIHGTEPDLDDDERALTTFAPDRTAYVRGHLVLATLGGVVAGVVLVALGNPSPWVGPVGAVLALGARGWYLASEVLAQRWRLTDRRLIVPGGRAFRLGRIVSVRPFLGDVQVITLDGDKHLIKYQSDTAAVIAAIERARSA